MPVKREYIAEAFRVQSHDTRGSYFARVMWGTLEFVGPESFGCLCQAKKAASEGLRFARSSERGKRSSFETLRMWEAGALNTITPECECVQEDF